MRSAKTIAAAEGELLDKIWYNRHLVFKYNVENGIETCDPKIWKGALASAEKMRQKYGGEKNLLPEDDFEWGMWNGKLSALRWVLGEDWDELYT